MPQLMPLNWFFSMFMLIFLFVLLIKMYFVKVEKVNFINKVKMNNNMIWLW